MLIILYKFLIFIFYLPYIVLIFLRKLIKKEHPHKYKEKIFLNKIIRPKGFLIWFHAASIGELKSILPLVEYYLKQNPNSYFLITTVTLSSYNEFEKRFNSNKRVFHQFMPYDFSFLIENFFKNWRPDIASFVDSEIWPNFILKINKEKIPLILLNARITKKSFQRWKVLGKSTKKIFGCFSSCISSSTITSQYLNTLGAQNIKFYGNIKFCSSIEKDSNNKNQFNNISKRKVWCALSTHFDEENLCAKTHLIAKKKVENILTIIIPRHIHRINKIYANLKNLGLEVQIKEEVDDIDNLADVVLVNYYGSVNKYLKNINQIFIGKSTIEKFENSGGQNPLDAAKIGCHIYHGPYVSNFEDIYKFLDNTGISEEITNAEDLANKLDKNFKKNKDINSEKIEKINTFSNEIFKNLINEYNKYIK